MESIFYSIIQFLDAANAEKEQVFFVSEKVYNSIKEKIKDETKGGVSYKTLQGGEKGIKDDVFSVGSMGYTLHFTTNPEKANGAKIK